jgi:hypothetical protein
MPNWCYNQVTLTNDDASKVKALVDEFERIAKENEGKDYNERENFRLFEQFYPTPKQLTEGDGWYDWNVSNWGTKWDVSPDECYQDGDNAVSFYFDSAWSPPIEFYNKLVADGWGVSAMYSEPGMEFCGEYIDGNDNYYEYPGTRERAKQEIPEDLYEFADLDTVYDWKEEDEDEED